MSEKLLPDAKELQDFVVNLSRQTAEEYSDDVLNKMGITHALVEKYVNLNTRQTPKEEETVEQWEKRNGRKYPEDGPVWGWDGASCACGCCEDKGAYFLAEYGELKDDYVGLLIAGPTHPKPDR